VKAILHAVQIARLACSYAGDEYKKKHLEKKKQEEEEGKDQVLSQRLDHLIKALRVGH